MKIQINKAEAIKLPCLYYGQEIEIEYSQKWIDRFGYNEKKRNVIIKGSVIEYFEKSYIKSFRFTSLRMMDEMTRAEKNIFFKVATSKSNLKIITHQNEYKVTPDRVDYLRSIGIYLGELPEGKHIKDITFEII